MAAPSYPVKTAVQLAAICEWIYGDHTWTPTTNAPLPGVEFVKHFHDRKEVLTPLGNLDFRTSFASVFRWDEYAVVAFQGTQFTNLLDWLRDLDARPVPFRLTFPGGLTLPANVHAGFLAELDEVLDDVVSCLQQSALVKGRPVLLTGHSQGGGEAFLAAAALSAMGFDVAGTYTFEAPRAGGETLAQLVKSPVWRFEYGHDVVPHVPPDARLGDDPRALAGSVIGAMRVVAGKLSDPFGKVLATIAKALELANTGFDAALDVIGGLLGQEVRRHGGLSVPNGVLDTLHRIEEQVPDPFKPIVFLLQRLLKPLEYRALGTLVYLPPLDEKQPPAPAIHRPTADEERRLFYDRLSALAGAGSKLVGHHVIAAWKGGLATIKV